MATAEEKMMIDSYGVGCRKPIENIIKTLKVQASLAGIAAIVHRKIEPNSEIKETLLSYAEAVSRLINETEKLQEILNANKPTEG